MTEPEPTLNERLAQVEKIRERDARHGDAPAQYQALHERRLLVSVIDDLLPAQPPATDRDALDALACEDCSGPAPSKEVDPRDPLGIVTPNPKPTCPVPGFGRNHLWMTGAFYVGSRLIQSDDYMICGSCGQIEYDAPEEPTRPAPDTLADRVQALADEARAAMIATAEHNDDWNTGYRRGIQMVERRLRALLAGRSDASPEGGA